MFERFTAEARATLVQAREESLDLGHGFVGTEHVLLALLVPASGTAHELLRAAGVDKAAVRAAVVRHTGPANLLDEADRAALDAVGVDVERLLKRIEKSFGPDALLAEPAGGRRHLLRRPRPTVGSARWTQRAKTVLGLALRETQALGEKSVGSEMILLGLLREGHGLGVQVLRELHVDLERLRLAIVSSLRSAA